MDKLVECIPNFSEGRRQEVISALGRAVLVHAEKGVRLLDSLADPDHNRLVLTFLGPPEAVASAAFDACRTAARLIDMESHRGSHPRIGATDVIPLVPLRGMEMAECVILARSLGSRIGDELGVPVYLYEEAAAQSGRRSLVAIRRGQYEGLKESILTDSERAPDFGPARLHPTAGATVVGARWPLIAFNVNLFSDDLQAAKVIARKVRESSGGLPSVRAIGLRLEDQDRVQVSMNLTNYRVTPIQVAFEAVKLEARARGIEVAESELIGLVPAEALAQAAAHYLGLRGLQPTQLLETHF